MIRNKILRPIFYNLLLIGADLLFLLYGWRLIGLFLDWLFPHGFGYGWGDVLIGMLILFGWFFFYSILRGIFNRLLICKTWIPNIAYTLTVFVIVSMRTKGTVWYEDHGITVLFFLLALLCGAISSGTSLITWAIQCKVQKKRAAKQAVNWED